MQLKVSTVVFLIQIHVAPQLDEDGDILPLHLHHPNGAASYHLLQQGRTST